MRTSRMPEKNPSRRAARRALVLSAASLPLVATAALAAAPAARPIDGARYAQRPSRDVTIAFRVARSGAEISSYDFESVARCNRRAYDHPRFKLTSKGEQGRIRIHSDGRFSLHVAQRVLLPDHARAHAVRGTEVARLDGRFAGRGHTVTGSLRMGFTGGSLRCSTGAVRYRAGV